MIGGSLSEARGGVPATDLTASQQCVVVVPMIAEGSLGTVRD